MEAKFKEFGHGHLDLTKSGRPVREENYQLKVVLSVEENPHIFLLHIV